MKFGAHLVTRIDDVSLEKSCFLLFFRGDRRMIPVTLRLET